MILIWMLVTLLSDWQAVFYRKHIYYRRRMEVDLAHRPRHMSFESSMTRQS